MDWGNIEKLLEKYENAETTLAEEKFLKEFFQNDEVPEHFQDYKVLFSSYSAFKEDEFKPMLNISKKKFNWYYLSIAASILLLFSISLGYNEYDKRIQAQKAYTETKQALDLLSYNMNKGNMAFVQLKEYQYTTEKVFNVPK